MKAINTSFLFFHVLFIIFSGLNTQDFFAQQSLDSLTYYSNLVQHPQKGVDLIKAYSFFINDKAQALKEKNINRAIFDLQYISFIEYRVGSYGESENSAVNALSYLDKVDKDAYNISLRSGLYNHLGMLYRAQKDSKKALALYTDAFKAATKVEDRINLFNNISNIYKDNKDYEAAKKELLKGYALLAKTNDIITIALIKDNLGFIYSKLNIDDLALKHINEALALREKAKDAFKVYTSKKHLSEFYKDRGDLSKANEFAFEAYNIAKKINSASYKEEALGLLIELGNDDYAISYKKINDSLSNARQIQENKFALIKYDFSEHKRKALESQLSEEQERNFKLIYLSIAVIILLTSIFFYFSITSKHKKDKLQQVYNTETRISKKVHDEVANDVYHVMTKLQGNSNANTEVLDDLEGIYNRTRDISKETSTIEVKENFDVLLNDLLQSYKNEEVNVVTRNLSKIDWSAVNDLKKTTFYRVLQELMTNMRKHSKASLVMLTFDQTKTKINIHYKDNGIGCTVLKNSGLQNTENRMEAIHGSITFDSQINNGFKAKITV